MKAFVLCMTLVILGMGLNLSFAKDDCDAKEKTCLTQNSDKHAGNSTACSQDCNCAGCSFPVLMPPMLSNLQFEKRMELEMYTLSTEAPVRRSFGIWQPPKNVLEFSI